MCRLTWLLAFNFMTLLTSTLANAVPVEESSSGLNFKDRFYTLTATEGESISEQLVVKGIANAPQCPSGSITLTTYAKGGSEAQSSSIMLWPRDESVAEKLCGLKKYLPLQYPLVTLSGKRLEHPKLSLNGKEITSSSVKMHLIPTELEVIQENVR